MLMEKRKRKYCTQVKKSSEKQKEKKTQGEKISNTRYEKLMINLVSNAWGMKTDWENIVR